MECLRLKVEQLGEDLAEVVCALCRGVRQDFLPCNCGDGGVAGAVSVQTGKMKAKRMWQKQRRETRRSGKSENGTSSGADGMLSEALSVQGKLAAEELDNMTINGKHICCNT